MKDRKSREALCGAIKGVASDILGIARAFEHVHQRPMLSEHHRKAIKLVISVGGAEEILMVSRNGEAEGSLEFLFTELVVTLSSISNFVVNHGGSAVANEMLKEFHRKFSEAKKGRLNVVAAFSRLDTM